VKFTSLTDEAYIALTGLTDYASDMINPTLRLGVTGLSRAGKTVFITSLVHNLVNGGKLPMFAPLANKRIKKAFLQPQPDDDVPRFSYEQHLEALLGKDGRHWPSSTNRISQLRLTIEYEPEGFLARNLSSGVFNIDIVDYPGEWLLDLPLLDLTYQEWSQQALLATQKAPRDVIAKPWLDYLSTLDADADEDEQAVQEAAKLFTQYLTDCREDEYALSTVPPGRFIMPGDLAGSPLITFSPLDVSGSARRGSLHAMMERRYNSYVSRVVKPFFINHFSRLDRQIVLVDALAALNAGPEAVSDLKNALGDILKCFRPGNTTFINAILGKKIDRILFAATKADHLHHTSHDRLENILRYLVKDAMDRSDASGAMFDVVALSAIRATREKVIEHDGEELPAIIGIPESGQKLGDDVYDGQEEIALFPGDLPENPNAVFAEEALSQESQENGFMKFRPPLAKKLDRGAGPESFPHIRLDKAMNFLFGDRLA
jgi:predicted YcjX-like family ATPase